MNTETASPSVFSNLLVHIGKRPTDCRSILGLIVPSNSHILLAINPGQFNRGDTPLTSCQRQVFRVRADIFAKLSYDKQSEAS